MPAVSGRGSFIETGNGRMLHGLLWLSRTAGNWPGRLLSNVPAPPDWPSLISCAGPGQPLQQQVAEGSAGGNDGVRRGMSMSGKITRFEQLAYLGLILAVVEAPIEIIKATSTTYETQTAVGAAKVLAIAGEVLGILIGWLPIWLIARRRKKWARWLFLLLYAAAIGFCVANFGRSNALFDLLNVLQALIWGCALWFLFTADQQSWLERGREPVVAAPATDLPPPRPQPVRQQTPRLQEPRPRTRVAAGRRVVVAPHELNHQKKVEAHVAEMGMGGVGKLVSAPPPFQLLWALGLEIPPPLFLGFLPTMLILSTPLLVIWNGLNLLFRWFDPLVGGLFGTLVCVFLGALGAAYYRDKAYNHALPSWENYLPMKSR